MHVADMWCVCTWLTVCLCVADNIKKRQEELKIILTHRKKHQEENVAEETSFVGAEQMEEGEGKESREGVREGKASSESGEASE